MLERRFFLAPRTRLLEAPPQHAAAGLLVCDHPLTLLELNADAWQLLQTLRPDGVSLTAEAHPAPLHYLEQLAARGLLRAEYRLLPPAAPVPADHLPAAPPGLASQGLPTWEVVVPVFATAEGDVARLGRCLASLAGLDYPAHLLSVTVVDDASPQPLRARTPLPSALGGGWGGRSSGRWRWLRLPQNRGPASARNAGVFTPWPDGRRGERLAFLDSDAVALPMWLRDLAAVLETPGVGAAAGRVLPLTVESWVARYEGQFSSLHLGPTSMPVGGAGHAGSYLPGCNLALRREAFEQVAGFQEARRVGEDVDLSWRLADAGWSLFYLAEPACRHDYRTRLWAFLRRKYDYAASEALLARQHPQRLSGAPQGSTLTVWGAATGAAALTLQAQTAYSQAGQAQAVAAWVALACALGACGVLLWQGLAPLWTPSRGLPHGRFSAVGWTAATVAGGLLRGLVGRHLAAARTLARRGLLPALASGLLWPPLLPLPGTLLLLALSAEVLARGGMLHSGSAEHRGSAADRGMAALGLALEMLAYSAGWLHGWARLCLQWRRGRCSSLCSGRS